MHSDILRDEPYRHLSVDLGRSWQAHPSRSPPPRSSLQAGRKTHAGVRTHTHTHGQAPRVVVCHHWPARSQPGCLLLVPVYEVRRAEICKRERSPAELLCSLFPPFLISGGRDVGFHSAGAAASSLRSSPLAAKADRFHSTSPSRPLSSPSLMVISISEDGLHHR